MNIISFSRIKIFHKDGRARVILKLRLPRLCHESAGAFEFNGFYEKLADEYVRLLGRVPYSTETGSRPTTVVVDFSVITEEYMKKHPRLSKRLASSVVINRETKINLNGEIRRFLRIDIYNIKTHVFLK